MQAAREATPTRPARFRRALFGHLRLSLGNGLRLLERADRFALRHLPVGIAPENRRYYQQLTRFSAAFAFLADVSMLVMGGDLKRKEKLSARLGDILSLLYLSSAALKRYEDEGRQQADLPLLNWSIWDAMFQAQNAFEGVISNYPIAFAAWLLRRVIFPFGRPYVIPSDKLGHEVAKLLIQPCATRDRLSAGMYLPRNEAVAEADAVGVIELALAATMAAEPIDAKIRAAQKAGKINGQDAAQLARHACESGLISRAELSLLERRAVLRDKVIRVDDFPQDFSLEQQQPLPERAAA